MSFGEYLIETQAKAPARNGVGALRCFRPRLLADIVDTIWDFDIPDSDAARTITIKYAPGTSLLLMAQYRAPVLVRHGDRSLPRKCAIQIHTHALTLHPTGALGVLLVCLRPEAAARIVDARLSEFADANIHLGNIFSAGEVSTCDDMLADARCSSERIATVAAFLLRRMRPELDCLACRAVSSLRSNPALSVQELASQLGLSARQLSRRFGAAFGITPKQFARLARLEKILAERRAGLSWAQTAYACGLTDQAHLVREFKTIVGELPTEFFAQELRAGRGAMNEANFIVQDARLGDVTHS
jgi:AraC-like DNA-binding protein